MLSARVRWERARVAHGEPYETQPLSPPPAPCCRSTRCTGGVRPESPSHLRRCFYEAAAQNKVSWHEGQRGGVRVAGGTCARGRDAAGGVGSGGAAVGTGWSPARTPARLRWRRFWPCGRCFSTCTSVRPRATGERVGDAWSDRAGGRVEAGAGAGAHRGGSSCVQGDRPGAGEQRARRNRTGGGLIWRSGDGRNTRRSGRAGLRCGRGRRCWGRWCSSPGC